MNAEYTIFGKGLSEEDHERAQKNLARRQKKEQKPLAGEEEKSETEIKIVELANSFLAKEFQKLGLEPPRRVPPEEVHFLTPAVYEEMTQKNNRGSAGIYDLEKGGRILVKKKLLDVPTLMSIAMHEIVHSLSYKKFEGRRDSGGSLRATGTRVGYLNVNQKDTSIEHFRYFNEAITEILAYKLLQTHRGEIASGFDIPEKEIELLSQKYLVSGMLLLTIMKSVATKKGENEEEVWTRFKRCLFTGEMMHLRDIERTYGKSALRILALFSENNSPKKDSDDSGKKTRDIKFDIMDYFESTSEDERRELARSILSRSKVKNN